jgi:hypothetical protein
MGLSFSPWSAKAELENIPRGLEFEFPYIVSESKCVRVTGVLDTNSYVLIPLSKRQLLASQIFEGYDLLEMSYDEIIQSRTLRYFHEVTEILTVQLLKKELSTYRFVYLEEFTRLAEAEKARVKP